MLNTNIEFVIITCYKCDMRFALTQSFYRKCKDKGATMHCPEGHSQVYTETTVQKLEKQLEERNRIIAQKNRNLDYAYTERDRAHRRAAAHKGVATKMKNRIKNGVCPCCNRHFKNLERHMENKHPDFATKDVKLDKDLIYSRIDAGHTQGQIAKEFGVSQTYVSNVKTGKTVPA